jgi:hypothetical protein
MEGACILASEYLSFACDAWLKSTMQQSSSINLLSTQRDEAALPVKKLSIDLIFQRRRRMLG